MKLKTRSGKTIHPIGIGTWGIASQRSDIPNEYAGVIPMKGNEVEEVESIKLSITLGQNHIDCAELYGGFYTDEIVGHALKHFNREDLFIADKLWRNSVQTGAVRPKVEQMLSKLQTDYLDMLYIHAPWPNIPWQEAIAQIDELIDEGVIRHFAVSNFGLQEMKQAISSSKHPIAANQVNFNVLHQGEVSEGFKQFCAEKNIQIVAYQPIKRGEVFENDIIQQISQRHGVTPAQIAIAWLLAQGVSPIPKATKKQHIVENLESLEITLTEKDMASLNSLA